MFKVTQLINIKNVVLTLNAILRPVILIRKNGHKNLNLGGENAKHNVSKNVSFCDVMCYSRSMIQSALNLFLF